MLTFQLQTSFLRFAFLICIRYVSYIDAKLPQVGREFANPSLLNHPAVTYCCYTNPASAAVPFPCTCPLQKSSLAQRSFIPFGASSSSSNNPSHPPQVSVLPFVLAWLHSGKSFQQHDFISRARCPPQTFRCHLLTPCAFCSILIHILRRWKFA
jgi:hypothetical protein